MPQFVRENRFEASGNGVYPANRGHQFAGKVELRRYSAQKQRLRLLKGSLFGLFTTTGKVLFQQPGQGGTSSIK